mmetsp:Transcript_42255/g.62606  ORF Transcript_42255/g.62606 Transcript_42255/m.62606 type:complete len:109 (-) Transcript_42255:72-398(-)
MLSAGETAICGCTNDGTTIFDRNKRDGCTSFASPQLVVVPAEDVLQQFHLHDCFFIHCFDSVLYVCQPHVPTLDRLAKQSDDGKGRLYYVLLMIEMEMLQHPLLAKAQ